ncbi:MAG: AAA domain-containing protein [Candidatus Kapabacteria bacterium]|nr:AAA domain-containing protein [Candidatus Kapabacteria bacterium]
MVILYPQDENLNQRYIFKTYIKEINSNEIVLSLRNKLINQSVLTKFTNWLIIPDSSDSINKKLYSEIYSFVNSNKVEYFIGNKQPRFENIEVDFKDLNLIQARICQKAINARDYFLIQGPPGTGKTSYVLKAIVEQIYNSTNYNILLVSYTNRAVDEICNAIKRISEEIEIIRLGSKEVSIHKELLFSELIENYNLKELNLKLKRTRIIASTVASLINTQEIFQIKHFDIAIIDEASQILEPYIVGIISKVNKFIMIGDEKQLPAITQQSEEFLQVKSKKLIEIGLENFSISYFERLLTNAKTKGWNECFDMLEIQNRMHKDIMNLINFLFYNNKLNLSENNWQSEEFNTYQIKSKLGDLLSKSRIVFINCPNENNYKFNKSEALLTIKIIEEIKSNLKDNFIENSIGVISPFRLQCSEISNLIEENDRKLITVDTVERFQGSERGFIIISTSVNKEVMLQSILSLVIIEDIEIDRKLNVALTRAKKQIVILGNEQVLSKSKIYKKMIDFIKEYGCFVNYDECYK